MFNPSGLLLLFTLMTSNRSEREVRGAGLVLQTVWGYKELRRTLEKDGWKKTDFVVNLNPPSNNTRANGGYEDSTLPLIDKGQEPKGERQERQQCKWEQVFRVFCALIVCPVMSHMRISPHFWVLIINRLTH